LKRHEVFGESLHRLDIPARPASVDLDVASLCPPKFSEFLPERRDRGLGFMAALGVADQHADPSQAIMLLRASGEWPGCRDAAEKRYELAPSHCLPQG